MRKSRLATLLLALVVAGGAGLVYRAWFLDQQAKQRLARRQLAWANLTQTLHEEIRRFAGEAAVIVEDLERGWQSAHHAGEPIPAASLVKIPIMAAVFEAATEGRVRLTDTVRLHAADKVPGSGLLKDQPNGSVWTLEQLVEIMITESDNTATNLLIERMGYGFFNRYCERVGLQQTLLVRKMMDFSKRDQGVENFTSAEDIATILRRLYRHEVVDEMTSERALNLLKRQTLNDRIPARLPSGTVVAHKTGLERHLCHDAGIVFTPKGDFLITVLTRHNDSTSQRAKTFIATVAHEAYQYLLEP